MPSKHVHVAPLQIRRFRFAAGMLLTIAPVVLLSGCAAMQLQRFKPVIAPLATTPCRSMNNVSSQAVYMLPGATSETTNDFENYYKAAQDRVRAKLPPTIQQHKVTQAFLEFFTTVSGEAQLDSRVANGVLRDNKRITVEREAIRKHSAPRKLTHGQMKDFASKLFDFQLKPGPAALTRSAVAHAALGADENELLAAHTPPDAAFIDYFKSYYHGNFVDRLGASVSKPQISTTIPDSDIAAAETVLLEFLIDAIDPTPVMGDTDSADANTTFYPGNSKKRPTALSAGLATYVKILKPGECGITTGNAWVLKALANGASDHAAAVGGLVANTPGGISFGLGVFGKISIGDNQTLSVLVKTAASRLALRATFATSYSILKDVYFNVSEP